MPTKVGTLNFNLPSLMVGFDFTCGENLTETMFTENTNWLLLDEETDILESLPLRLDSNVFTVSRIGNRENSIELREWYRIGR